MLTDTNHTLNPPTSAFTSQTSGGGPDSPLPSSPPNHDHIKKAGIGHKKPPYLVQTRVLGGRQQNYAFASSVDPKLVKFNSTREVIAVASGHCHLWFQYAPPCNVRLAIYDAATLFPLRLFDLLAGPLVEHLAWHPTKPIVALATSMLDYFGQQYMGGQLFLLNWKTGQRAALLKEGRPVTYCHFTDDGRLVFRVAGRGDLGEQDACYAVGKDIYGTWRNGCVRLDRLRAVDELEGRHKTGNHSHHHTHADADADADADDVDVDDGEHHHHLAISRKRAKEESDEMMVTYCFVEEDIVASPAPTPATGSGGNSDQAAGAASSNNPACKPTLFQGEVAKETKWERKLRRIAEEKGKHYETSKTVWGVDFHDDDTLAVTKWDKSLEVWSRRPEKNKDWSKKMNIYSHYDSGLQIQSLKDTTGEDAVIVTEGLDHTRWRIVKILIPSGRTAWARHFDLGVNYTARMNRTGHTLVECSELPPENARLIAPDGKMTTTSIMSPLLHSVTLYNFCQKQTDEFFYCSKEEGQPIMLCQFNPVENTYTKLFPLSAFGPNVERLRNGVYVKDALGEGLIVDVTTRFKTVNIVRIDLNTHKKVWEVPVKYDVCEIALLEEVGAVAFAQPEGYLGLLSCADGKKLHWEQVRVSEVVTPITSLSAKGAQIALGTTDGRVVLYQVEVSLMLVFFSLLFLFFSLLMIFIALAAVAPLSLGSSTTPH